MKSILIGSPIHQNKEILKEFLTSLTELEHTDFNINYCFIDDNSDEESSKVLEDFKTLYKDKVKIFKSKTNDKYICDDYTHQWSQYLVKKVTLFKNKIIDVAIQGKYDYLFFIDSDIVLHPKTLKRLVEVNKEVVSNIFWTQWRPDGPLMPQVWLQDSYAMHNFKSNENPTAVEIAIETREFINKLKLPGTYEVGGLGACTLIKYTALAKGVNFNEVHNVSFWGEDRHFCIRAAVLGIGLWVDTYYPAYHIYRQSDLSGVDDYKEKNLNRDTEIIGVEILNMVREQIENSSSFESKISLLDCEIDFPKKSGSDITATLKWNEEGYVKDRSFYKEYIGKCILEHNGENKWNIKQWENSSEIVVENEPLIRKAKTKDNKLTLSMIVKNEGDRYLKEMLEAAREYIDNAVIIDDGSVDNTIEVIEEALKDIPYKLIKNKASKFHNEIDIRKQQWEETIKINPDWILFLDSDEIFEKSFKSNIKSMMEQREIDGYLFRLYDFWDSENYREDELWNAHKSHRLFMIRYQENFNYRFRETAQHCGRLPVNAMDLCCSISNLRLKHYGWAKEEDRINKYERYMRLDKGGEFGNLAQYYSILDKNPNLQRWNEDGE